MHVLIIFMLIFGLVLARIHSSKLKEGIDLIGQTGATGPEITVSLPTEVTVPTTTVSLPTEVTAPTVVSEVALPIGGIAEPVPFVQTPLYNGVW